MKVLIIEDEQIAADHLRRLLAANGRKIEVLAVIPSVQKAVNWLRSNPSPDLIFLDIQLSDDISFRIFEQTHVQAPVIFTTAYDHYAIKAFEVNSIYYLLKPFNQTELEQALQKYQQLRSYTADALRQILVPETSYQQRFMVTSGARIKSIQADDIAWFQADGRYVKLMLLDGNHYITDQTLDKLEETLNPALFYRINRQYIINMKAIVQMTAYTRGRIKIETTPEATEPLVVSVDRSAGFKAWLNY